MAFWAKGVLCLCHCLLSWDAAADDEIDDGDDDEGKDGDDVDDADGYKGQQGVAEHVASGNMGFRCTGSTF